MLKTGTAALLLTLAVPGMAQTAPPASPAPAGANMAPPPEFIQSAQAFGMCIGTGSQGADAKLTPEAAAASVLAGCQTQRARMESLFEGWVASASFPEDRKALAREQFRSRMAEVPAQIADGIRQGRAAAPKP